MKIEAGIKNGHSQAWKKQLSDEKSEYIDRLLKAGMHRYFLEYLQDGKSAYKDVAVNWFQVICWTGISAKTWRDVYIHPRQPCYLLVRKPGRPPACLCLINFTDGQIRAVQRLLDFFSLLDERGFERVFHECRQLYARGSRVLWPGAEFHFGFRLALDIFSHRYSEWTESSTLYLRARCKSPRNAIMILPSPRS